MAPFVTPTAQEGERVMSTTTPTRQRPSFIPAPTHFSAGAAAGIGLGGPIVRASSAASHISDSPRTGRSSSLSHANRAYTPTPAPGSASNMTQLARAYGPADEDRLRSVSVASNFSGRKMRSHSTGSEGSEHDLAQSEREELAPIDDSDDGERVLPVKVAVRIRPLAVSGAAMTQGRDQMTACVEAPSPTSIAVGGEGRDARAYHFDHAFGPDAEQAAVYDVAIAPLLARFVEGYNVTVLAYGQTSSGKTYTMGTDPEDNTRLLQPGAGGGTMGIVPRALQWFFAWAAARSNGDLSVAPALREGVEVRVTFLEVYNDSLVDLVAQAQGHGGREIVVREDPKTGNIVWYGAEEMAVVSASDALDILINGSRERQTGSTEMNDKSSRSHAIYSISLRQMRVRRGGGSGGGDEQVKVESKLHFVDLAGSERLKKTQAVGDRQRQGIAINSGLLTLGNVIKALSDAAMHVPYRDSKLTQMLRDSLGGSAQTLLIACVSASRSNMDETVNTLSYAARARNIKNRGGINMVSMARATSKEIEALRAQVRRLRGELRERDEEIRTMRVLDGEDRGFTNGRDSEARMLGIRDSMLRGSDVSLRASHASHASPTKIPTRSSALQRRAQTAEERMQALEAELATQKSRCQSLEMQAEQHSADYADLLLKFNDACADIEQTQSRSFERDQRLRNSEMEIRRLTSHSRSSHLPSLAESRDSSRAPSVADPVLQPALPDLAHLRNLRTASMVSTGTGRDSPTGGRAAEGGPAPGAAEFDEILELADSAARAEQSARDALAGAKQQLELKESQRAFTERLAESLKEQNETLSLQVTKARQCAEEEEQRRRTAEAELEDERQHRHAAEVDLEDERQHRHAAEADLEQAAFAAEAHAAAAANEWQIELQCAEERCADAERDRDEALAENDRLHSELQAESSKVMQLMSPPPTAYDVKHIDDREQENEHERESVSEPESATESRPKSKQSQSQEPEQSEAELLRLNALVRQMETELTQHGQASRKLESQLQQRSETAQQLESDLEEHRVLAQDAGTRAGAAEETARRLRSTLLERDDAIQQLEADLDTQKSMVADASARIAAAEEAARTLNAQALQSEDAVRKLEADLAAHKAAYANGSAEADLDAQPPVARSHSDLPQRTCDKIVLCARNSASRKLSIAETEAEGLSPAEKRLRAMHGYRYSSAVPRAAIASPEPHDRFASYPELQLASGRSLPVAKAAGVGPGGRPLPVYDEDQIQKMLAEAAVEAEHQARRNKELSEMAAEITRLKEAKKELQGRNSQFKNLMRDLGDRLVELAEENDMLEGKVADREKLAEDVAALKSQIADLQARLQAAEPPKPQPTADSGTQASEPPRSSSTALDRPPSPPPAPEEQEAFRAKLAAAEAELAAAKADLAARAQEARERQDDDEAERLQAEIDALKANLDEAAAQLSRVSRDRDIWKSRSQDMRDELDELSSVQRRRSSRFFCFH